MPNSTTTTSPPVPVTPGTLVRPIRGYHVARFGRARRRGLISAAGFGAVTTAAVVFCNSTTIYDGTPRRCAVTGPPDSAAQARELPAVRAIYAAFSADPGVGKMASHTRRMLIAACDAAGVELGAFDRRIFDYFLTQRGIRGEDVMKIPDVTVTAEVEAAMDEPAHG